jgi:hypothetical protein
VAVVCLIAVAVGSTALASWPFARGSATLQPIGDEPSASGEGKAVWKGWYVDFWGYKYAVGTASVSCKGLTPGATYSVYCYQYQIANGRANGKGNVTMQGDWMMPAAPTGLTVYRGIGGVAVLGGPIVWQY